MEVSRRVLGQGAVRALALLVLFGLGARAEAEQPVYRIMPSVLARLLGPVCRVSVGTL